MSEFQDGAFLGETLFLKGGKSIPGSHPFESSDDFSSAQRPDDLDPLWAGFLGHFWEEKQIQAGQQGQQLGFFAFPVLCA